MSSPFSALIAELATFVKASPEQALDSPVEFDIDGTVITLHLDSNSGQDEIILSASLGVIEEKAELKTYRVLLEGNLFWSATNDATIGVNSETREAFITFKCPMSQLNGEALAQLMAHFLQIVLPWKELIAANNANPENDGFTQKPSVDLLKV